MAREQRRLAAIVAADVVGYSRLMGRDESGTLARLREHRKQRFEPTLARHGGRLVKLTGDGALVEFPSAVDALSAAIEFQQAMGEANRDQPEGAAIVFRIGVHLGDLIVDGDDLYGDGVNVAARLEAEAPAGGILASGDVHNAVAGRLKASFEDLGKLSLKNIERPVQAFGLRWKAADWPTASDAKAPLPAPAAVAPSEPGLALPDKPSIAVLPFQNMSGDPEQEYFADGMVEDIITALSRFKSLFVIARNSSFSYKGKFPDVRKVGSDLGVKYVLEGSVRKAANRLRITAQLIDTLTGNHIWADRFDGALEDVFALQDGITEKVVVAIAPRLEQAEMLRARRKPSGSLDAYDCYLRGLASTVTISRKTIDAALSLFERAIELDPEYSSAYGMALMYRAARRGFGVRGDPETEKTEITRLVRIVAGIGRDDAVALSGAAWATAFILRDLSAAKALADQALAVNPNLAFTWAYSGWINLWLGHPDIALEHARKGIRLDPLLSNFTASIRTTMAHSCYFLGQHQEAVAQAENALQHSPDSIPALRIGTASAAFAGMSDVMQRMGKQLLAVDPAFRISRVKDYLGPYRREDFVEKYAEGLRRAGLPE